MQFTIENIGRGWIKTFRKTGTAEKWLKDQIFDLGYRIISNTGISEEEIRGMVEEAIVETKKDHARIHEMFESYYPEPGKEERI